MRPEKIGHAGTLDPLATGVLPLALGDGTKMIPYLQDQDKSYRFTVQWGDERDTDDVEGKTVKTSDARPTQTQIENLLPQFTGDIMQVPCTFSAIKVNGERAYDLARAGEEVKLEARPIRVDSFTLVNCPTPDSAIFEVVCGKGSYMRALARDLGRELGCFGHLTAIRRLNVAGFVENDAIKLDELTKMTYETASSCLLPLAAGLDDIPAYAADEGQVRSLRHGQSIILARPQNLSGAIDENRPLVRVMIGDDLIAITRLEAGELIPIRVMQPQP
jgi:tRNA pseudouridine55 synthase